MPKPQACCHDRLGASVGLAQHSAQGLSHQAAYLQVPAQLCRAVPELLCHLVQLRFILHQLVLVGQAAQNVLLRQQRLQCN